MREQEIQNKIRVAVSAAGHLIFRANVGKVRMENDRWFDTGLPQGFPDLFGTSKDGRSFYIECKNEKGQPQEEQIKFHKMLVKRGIVHGIARSPEDALKIIRESLVGYGFKGED